MHGYIPLKLPLNGEDNYQAQFPEIGRVGVPISIAMLDILQTQAVDRLQKSRGLGRPLVGRVKKGL
jgi:hypothetical protein